MWDLLSYFKNGGLTRSYLEREELEKQGEVLRNKIDNYYVDSCWTFDSGYETAIWTKEKEHIVIVEYYDTKEKMVEGHKKWCEKVKKKPKTAISVQRGEREKL